VEYIYVSSQKHKTLRLLLEQRHADIDRTRTAFDELTNYLNSRFFEAAAASFQQLHIHFRDRGRKPPRISIRGNFRTGGSQDTVVTIFGDSVTFGNTELHVSEDASLQYSARTGRYYFCNDLLAGVASGEYYNRYINQDRVKNVLALSPVLGKFALERRWSQVWASTTGKARALPASRSVLVVPIALDGKHVTKEFVSNVDIGDVDQLIFGFVSFEHDDHGYFSREIDVPVSYIAADLLSIYAFHRMKYTEFSETYKRAIAVVQGKPASTRTTPQSNWQREEEHSDDIQDTLGKLLEELRETRRRVMNESLGTDDISSALVANEESILSLLANINQEDLINRVRELATGVAAASVDPAAAEPKSIRSDNLL
jgi:hypothetical protein